MRERIEKLLEQAYKLGKELKGTLYTELKDGLYLVAAWNEDEAGIIAKIAYNNSALQCDYDLDWTMPTSKDGDVAYTEVLISENDVKSDASFFEKELEVMIKHRDAGYVIDWRN